MTGTRSERTLLLLVSAVQFVNVLDFVMVMPLGPDFAASLGIPMSRLGLVTGSYTLAAAAAGIAGSSFLDRFDRRSALAVAMAGLVAATAAGGFSTGLGTLLASRVAAGLFGGPATSLSFAIVADAVPPERRGRAMGVVMGAFSVAAVLGVPAGLWMAQVAGWRAPFLAAAALGVVVAGASLVLMPRMTAHLHDPSSAGRRGYAFLRDPAALLSLSATGSTMLASFALVPNLAAFLQFNAGWPRERLGTLYLLGGLLSFAVLRVVGRAVDRFGAPRVAAAGTSILVANMALGIAPARPLLPAWGIFLLFILANSLRNPALSSLASRVPLPAERARFQSTQSAVQHLASAAGALLSSVLLATGADGALVGTWRVAALSGLAGCALPVLLSLVEPRVRRREATRAGAAALAPEDGI
ncbi:MAG TPA: MFS transporter [Anaeromyxobacteraceae bacterium]|nr:MFS transporter [Anaeromyxobacteraceae bacterium]